MPLFSYYHKVPSHVCKVKVKFKDEIVTAVIVKAHFISKLSYDCHYFFATAKVDVNLPDSSIREFQLRDLIF